MIRQPYFSIVIPVFNRPAAIQQAVDSCLAQTFDDFEIIVVDDGSTESACDALKDIRDKRLKCVRLEKNRGVSTARNIGMDLASGRYIAFLDSDDIFEKEKLRIYHQHLSEAGHPENVCFSSPLYFRRENGHRLQVPKRLYQEGEEVLHYIFVTGGVMSTDTLVVSADIARKTQFRSDLNRHEDYDFCWRLEKAGVRFKMLPDTLSTCIDHEDPGRLTQSTGFKHSSYWINSIADDLPRNIYAAFQLRVLAPMASGQRRGRGLQLYFQHFLSATGMSPSSRLICLVKCISPEWYRRLTTRYVAWRGSISPV
jgi:glycosyltransferase involved in cell wall biosynthesis